MRSVSTYRTSGAWDAAMAAGLTMSGQCNIGESEHDFRVPDGALHRSPPEGAHGRDRIARAQVQAPSACWTRLGIVPEERVAEKVSRGGGVSLPA